MDKILDKLKNLAELEEQIGDKNIKRLDFKLLERVTKRLDFFSNEKCEECKKYLVKIKNNLETLNKNHGQLNKLDFKEHQRIMNDITAHLQKNHKLVPENYYIGIFMSYGMCFGLIFGLLMFDNVALGLIFGLCLGVAIGSAKDADAKKKGLTI